MTNYRGLMAENTGRVVNSLVFLVTMFGHNIFTLSSADNNLVFSITHLFMMTLLLMHDIVVQGALNIQGARRKCLCCTGQKKKSTRSEHSDNDRDSSHLI